MTLFIITPSHPHTTHPHTIPSSHTPSSHSLTHPQQLSVTIHLSLQQPNLDLPLCVSLVRIPRLGELGWVETLQDHALGHEQTVSPLLQCTAAVDSMLRYSAGIYLSVVMNTKSYTSQPSHYIFQTLLFDESARW